MYVAFGRFLMGVMVLTWDLSLYYTIKWERPQGKDPFHLDQMICFKKIRALSFALVENFFFQKNPLQDLLSSLNAVISTNERH